MRIIKFRGKRCDDGEWVYGYYARLRNEFKEWHCIMTEEDASENYIKDCNGYNMLYTPVNHNTVGQFTGLLDKNGKGIYEGDIITEGVNKFICEYHEGCFVFRDTSDGKFILNAIVCISHIIGNIHDNPDLMKGGEEI